MTSPVTLLMSCLAGGRKLLVYGAGSQGRGVLHSLRACGFEPAGLVDRNPDLQGRCLAGLPVFAPAVLEVSGAADRYLVIIAAFFFEHEISAYLDSLGFVKGIGYLPYRELKPRDYAVEVSGVCNLRCISCPRADRRPAGRNAAMMSLDTFKQVVAKIRREDPFVSNVQIYQWGEPTLNKSLPEMIRHARDQGLLCSVSSNLNHPADFRALLAAGPECLRVSVSGVGPDYEITHSGGNWEVFRANLGAIAALRRELCPEMKVELYYHRYRHGVGKQQDEAAALCKQLGFEFHPVPAYIISLDDVLAYCEGVPLPEPAQRARDLLLVDIDEGLRQAKAEAALGCDAMRVVMINADISVSACMMFYDPAVNTVADNYLKTPLAEILERRAKAPLCVRCRKHGVHRYCGIYAKLGEEARY